jgi:hypothetical protein
MFDDGLTDTRSRKQRKVARESEGYQQKEMFAQREIAQFGVQARPRMPAVARNGKPLEMVLEMEDPRTEEEKALAQQKAAEERTEVLFPDHQTIRDGTTRPQRLPEETAKTSHSPFGPHLHFYRSIVLFSLAFVEEL